MMYPPVGAPEVDVPKQLENDHFVHRCWEKQPFLIYGPKNHGISKPVVWRSQNPAKKQIQAPL